MKPISIPKLVFFLLLAAVVLAVATRELAVATRPEPDPVPPPVVVDGPVEPVAIRRDSWCPTPEMRTQLADEPTLSDETINAFERKVGP